MSSGRLLGNLARLTPRRIGRKLWRTFGPEFEAYRGLRLPPKYLRHQMCGEAFQSNEYFLQSGIVEARRLVESLDYEPGARILDVGSGLGRLATGMLWEFGEVPYLGVDVNPSFVGWCHRNISGPHPSLRFVHLDAENARYNPEGRRDALRFPAGDGEVDLVYVWGVFTNIGPEDAVSCAREIARVLRPGGKAFLTSFVEEKVPDVSFNPAGYGPYVHDGSPLLVVRFERSFLVRVFEDVGLQVVQYRHHGGYCPYQSEIYLERQAGAAAVPSTRAS